MLLAIITISDSAKASVEDLSYCTETQYGDAEYGKACIKLNVTTFSKCSKGAYVYIHYGYEGKDADGDICYGGKDDEFAMYVSPNTNNSAKVAVCNCYTMTKAWIVGVTVKSGS
jgi:hypothetical protein